MYRLTGFQHLCYGESGILWNRDLGDIIKSSSWDEVGLRPPWVAQCHFDGVLVWLECASFPENQHHCYGLQRPESIPSLLPQGRFPSYPISQLKLLTWNNLAHLPVPRTALAPALASCIWTGDEGRLEKWLVPEHINEYIFESGERAACSIPCRRGAFIA